MRHLIKMFAQYNSHIKYILLVVVLLAMIMSIRTYLNFVAIEDAIVMVEQDTENIQEEMFFVEKFMVQYLSSSYADYFLAHENNILLAGEFVVKFEEQKPELVQEDVFFYEQKSDILNARQSWQHFWGERLKKAWN